MLLSFKHQGKIRIELGEKVFFLLKLRDENTCHNDKFKFLSQTPVMSWYRAQRPMLRSRAGHGNEWMILSCPTTSWKKERKSEIQSSKHQCNQNQWHCLILLGTYLSFRQACFLGLFSLPFLPRTTKPQIPVEGIWIQKSNKMLFWIKHILCPFAVAKSQWKWPKEESF